MKIKTILFEFLLSVVFNLKLLIILFCTVKPFLTFVSVLFCRRKRSRSRDRHRSERDRDRDRSSRKRRSSSRSPSKGSTKDSKEMIEIKTERDDSPQLDNVVAALPLKTKP